MSSNPDAPAEQETTGPERTSETSANPTDGTGSNSRQTNRQNEESLLNSGRESFNALAQDQQIVIAGAAITVIGSFLPWASAFGTSVLGVNGDGVITLVLGLVAAAVVYWMPLSNRDTNLLAASAAGILVVLVGLYSITNFAAIGLYVTILGGLVVAYPGVRTAVSNYQQGSAESR